MTGLFNRTVLIRYDNYRRYFPVRALADFAEANGLLRGPDGRGGERPGRA
jgi:hypothetical protein